MGKSRRAVKLTKRLVDTLRPTDKEQMLFDAELRGFGLRIMPSGVKSYFIQYRNPPGRMGRTRRLSLGRHGELTPDEARKLAREKLAEVARGGDPSADRHRRLEAPTVADLAENYLELHARAKKKASSIRSDESLLTCHILPAFGSQKVEGIGSADVQRLHHAMRETSYQANRMLALLSKMMNLAEQWGIRPPSSNPCRHVERFKERRRERFLSSEELARLGAVLAETERDGTEPPSAVLAIRLLLLTGARKSEILQLRWEEVDFARRRLHLSDSKTGEKVIPLSAPAVELLAEAPRLEDNPYVCLGERRGHHLVGLPKIWLRLREAAGLSDVRLHDLRHSFASVGAGGGMSLPMIGALLGHSQPETTARYAHLAADPLREAADRIGGEIAAHLNGESSEVGPFKPRS